MRLVQEAACSVAESGVQWSSPVLSATRLQAVSIAAERRTEVSRSIDSCVVQYC